MTRASAKAQALLIVKRWWELAFPISGSLNGYSIHGTRTGRITMMGNPHFVDPAWARWPGPNLNGDVIPVVEMNQAEVEARVLRRLHIPREPELEPDMLTDRETAVKIQRALFDYAAADAEITALMAISMEQGVPIVTAIQQKNVLTRI